MTKNESVSVIEVIVRDKLQNSTGTQARSEWQAGYLEGYQVAARSILTEIRKLNQ